MSPRFWLFSLASAGAALTSGLGLGLYATTSPRTAVVDYQEPASATQREEDPSLWAASDDGPTEVKCTGCGPTLAQRQMASLMGSWDGYDDPAVRDYERQDIQPPEDLLADVPDAPPSPPMHQLPDNVERFAAGDTAAPQPARLVQVDPEAVNGALIVSQP